jgi:hypothetical protein
MTTRAKLVVCVGLLVLAVGVVMVRKPTAKPQVEVRFVRYESNGAPVLSLTNQGQQPVCFPGMDVWLSSAVSKATFHASPPSFILAPGGGMELVVPISAGVWPETRGTAVIQYAAQPSKIWRGVEEFLSEVGVEIASTGFVATVTLPPRETAASSSNTPPARNALR